MSLAFPRIQSRLDAAIRFFLYVLIFWLPYSPAVVEVCVVAALVLWIVKHLATAMGSDYKEISFKEAAGKFLGNLRPQKSFIDPLVFFYLGVGLVSVLRSPFIGQSAHGLFTKTLEWFIVFYLIIETFQTKRHLAIALMVYIVTSFSTVLDGLFQFYVSGKDIFLGNEIVRGGATAGFHHANGLAAYLIVFIPICFSLAFVNKSHRLRFILYSAMGVISVWALVITFSRGAMLSLAMGGFIMLYGFNKKMFCASVLIGVFLFLSAYAVLPIKLKDKVRLDEKNIYGTMLWRVGLWQDSLKMIKEKPILGHGLNTYMRLFQDYRRKLEKEHDYSPTYAHNCYLQMWAEVGVVGLLLFIIMMYMIIKRTLLRIRGSFRDDEDLKVILSGLLLGGIVYLTHSFFEVNLYTLQLSVYFWLLMGIMVATQEVKYS